MYAVDGYAETAYLIGKSLGQVDHGYVTGASAEVAGVSGIAAADVYDSAPTLLFHEGNGGSGTTQCSHVLYVKIAY